MSNNLWDDVAHEVAVELIAKGIKAVGKRIIGCLTAPDLYFNGTGSFRIDFSDNTVNLKIGRIDNDRWGGRSGTLQLRLWATDSPYDGGEISGYVLAKEILDPLQGGSYRYDIDFWTDYTVPPSGYYYITLTLEEYDNGNWPIVNWVTFDDLYNL